MVTKWEALPGIRPSVEVRVPSGLPNTGLQRTAATPLQVRVRGLAISWVCSGQEVAPPLPLKPNVGPLLSIRKDVLTMFSLHKLWSYSWGTIVRPTRTFETIAAEGSLVYPAIVMITYGLLYSLLSYLIYLAGQTPSLPILITVPPEKFYLAEAIYLLPFTLQFWVLFTGLCHLFAGRKCGSFDSALAVLGFASAIPNLVMFWLPDFLSFVAFGRILNTLVPIYGVAWFVWLVWLSGIGLKVTHHISTWKGVFIALVAWLVHFSIGFFFIR